MRGWKRLAAAALALVAVSGSASATWSIVVIDRKTGEVAVASATCLANTDLKRWVPVVRVGVGGGAAQSFLDTTATNRKVIRDGLRDGDTPEEILDELRFGAGTQPFLRQYGIAAFSGPPVTFTGNGAGAARGGVAGQAGSLDYAIQGNLLTGEEVVAAAEAALLATEGDLGQRVMAAMEAARALGGDGRCSCDDFDPSGCGTPPPNFQKSAHCGFLVIARHGDADAGCNQGNGCAFGDYYLTLNVSGAVNDPDPVYQLQALYDSWRADMAGRPDGVRSRARVSAQALPADGLTSMEVTVRLADLEGELLESGGALVEVNVPQNEEGEKEGGPLVTLGPVIDGGDGTYRFEVTAGTRVGEADLIVTADDGTVRATLVPSPKVRLDPVVPLHDGFDVVRSTRGARVPFVVNSPSTPGAFYLIVGSASGTDPGTDLGLFALPLNYDSILARTVRAANTPRLPGTLGFLDATGRAEAALDAPPGLLNNHVGGRLDWAAVLYDESGFHVTAATGFDVVP